MTPTGSHSPGAPLRRQAVTARRIGPGRVRAGRGLSGQHERLKRESRMVVGSMDRHGNGRPLGASLVGAIAAHHVGAANWRRASRRGARTQQGDWPADGRSLGSEIPWNTRFQVPLRPVTTARSCRGGATARQTGENGRPRRPRTTVDHHSKPGPPRQQTAGSHMPARLAGRASPTMDRVSMPSPVPVLPDDEAAVGQRQRDEVHHPRAIVEHERAACLAFWCVDMTIGHGSSSLRARAGLSPGPSR